MITLPWPPETLSPNARPHWSRKQRAVRQYRQDAYFATAAGSWPVLSTEGKIPLIIEFCPPDRRHRDLDNLIARIKAGLDGIADRIGVDDSRFQPLPEFGPRTPGGEVRITFGASGESR